MLFDASRHFIGPRLAWSLAGITALAACGGGNAPAVATAGSSTAAAAAVIPASATSESQAAKAVDVALPVRNVQEPAVVSKEPTPVMATIRVPVAPPTKDVRLYARVVYVDGAAAASGPGSGSAAAPYKTVSAAAANLRAGDDVVIAPGVYRERVVVPTLVAGGRVTRIRAQTARTVTIKGSDEVDGWTAVAPGLYSVPWSGDEPEQVYRAGVPLKQIGGTVFGGYPFTQNGDLAGAHAGEGGVWLGRVAGGIDAMTADSFTYDSGSRRLYVKTSSAVAKTEKLEVSARPHVLQAENVAGLSVEGIDFAHANTSFFYRWGAVKMVGQSNALRNITVRDMDATCVQVIGDDNAVLDSIIERCGQVGITGSGNRLTVGGNQILYNNTRGFNTNWEAGGMKMIGAGGLHNAVVRDNVVAYNYGDGIWFDSNNSGNLIENNTSSYNRGFGIHYELSRTGTIRGNRTYGNANRGIYLVDSANSVISGNAVFGNAMEGIGVIEDFRAANDPALKPVNTQVFGNTVAWNDFNRNWIQLVLPAANYGSTSDRNAFKAEGIDPRMVFGFFTPTNYPCERLSLWQAQARLDLQSTTQTVAMPAALRTALDNKRLLTVDQLPDTLRVPGTY